MQFITPIFFILVSIGIFFGYVDPQYSLIKTDKAIERQYDEALDQSKELLKIRDDLLSQYNTLDPTSLARLKKLLPDNIDNVKLIMEIDGMAKARGINVRNIIVRGETAVASASGKKPIVPDSKDYESVVLEFSFGASYEDFKKLLRDLEMSLRLVDVEVASFIASEDDFNEYKIAIKTYWLK